MIKKDIFRGEINTFITLKDTETGITIIRCIYNKGAEEILEKMEKELKIKIQNYKNSKNCLYRFEEFGGERCWGCPIVSDCIIESLRK